MSPRRFLQRSLPPLLLISSLFALYLRTMAPGLTWANDGRDGGDLITAAATGGVAHPSGYPLYLLLARLVQSLPVGTLAFRTNLLSAIATTCAAVLVYLLVRDSLASHKETNPWPAALAAGFAFGLAPLVWSQAVITEVYGLQACLVALVLYLYTRPRPLTASGQKHLDLWRGLALGLAMGNHVTSLLLVPAALAIGSGKYQMPTGDTPDSADRWFQTLKLDRDALLRQLGMSAAGLSLYLIIPLRAFSHPPINWGNAVTLERFWWLVSGQIYHSYYLQFNQAGIWERIQALAALLLQQFGSPGLVLGLTGLIVFGKRSRLLFLTLWSAGMFSTFAILYGSADSYVYLIPVCLSFAVWIGLGIHGLASQLGERSDLLRTILALLLIGYVGGRSMTNIHQLNASVDNRAESFGRKVLAAAPAQAMLFAKGDEAVFALWYFHFALGERPDVAVLATDLLHFDWYQENLRSTYPSLIVPAPFPWTETIVSANPARPICYVQYSKQTEMNCSPPTRSP